MRIKSLMASIIFFACTPNLCAQKGPGKTQKPKLVVGIVIDQMRWDYLYRFNSLYGTGGFRRLLAQGFSFENTLIPYTPTYTAPGHTCVYTGSLPAIHGIVGNYWYDKITRKNIYCTEDSTVATLGSSSYAGKISPANMWTTTVTDELRLSNNFKSKVIGISIKDRGAILPAGHSANAAYWFDPSVGKWISSTHYMKELPGYVNRFNDKDLPGKYMANDWNTLLPIEKYSQSTADDKPYETVIPGLTSVTFPHKLSLIEDKYDAFRFTPFASSFTFDFAKTVVENEKMGSSTVPDFLAVSISSTDYTGHHFGPNSIEVEDSYLRLDKDIADFLNWLDAKVGKDNYLFFLTADHAVSHTAGFLKEHKIPAGTFSNYGLQNELNKMIKDKFGIDKLVPSVQNYQVYIDKTEISRQGKNEAEIIQEIILFLQQKPFVLNVFETGKIMMESISEPQKEYMLNGYNIKRSGDIQFMLKPGYYDGTEKGTTHGAWNPYDAHIPLLFFGWNIKHGKTFRQVNMTDIAPTVAALLQVQMPNGNVGNVLPEIID